MVMATVDKVQIWLLLPVLLVLVGAVIGAVSLPALDKKHHDRPPRYIDQGALEDNDELCLSEMGEGYVWDDGVETCVACTSCRPYHTKDPHCSKCRRYGFISPTITYSPTTAPTTLPAETTTPLPTTMPETSTLPTTVPPEATTLPTTLPPSVQETTTSTLNTKTTFSNTTSDKATQDRGGVPVALIVSAAVVVFIALCLLITLLILTLKNPHWWRYKVPLSTEETGTPAESHPMTTVSADASEE